MGRCLSATFFGLVLLTNFGQSISLSGCSQGFQANLEVTKCYKAFFGTSSWHSAQQECEDNMSSLASVTSIEEMEFIWDHIVREIYYYYWIGLYKNSSKEATPGENSWQWVDGAKYNSNWTIWLEDQPGPDDKFGIMYMSLVGDHPHWSGEITGKSKHAFICNYDIQNSVGGTTESFLNESSVVPEESKAVSSSEKTDPTLAVGAFSRFLTQTATQNTTVQNVIRTSVTELENDSETTVSQEDSNVETTTSVMDNINISTATTINDASEAMTINITTYMTDTLEDRVVSTDMMLSSPFKRDPPSLTTATNPTSCSQGFQANPEGTKCYKAFLDTSSWHSAQGACEENMSSLASVTSIEEMEFIWDHIVREIYYYYWIGLYKNTSKEATPGENSWQWVDGAKYNSNWTIWLEDQPGPDDKYGIMYMSLVGDRPHWSGEITGKSKHAFICNYDLQNSAGSTSDTFFSESSISPERSTIVSSSEATDMSQSGGISSALHTTTEQDTTTQTLNGTSVTQTKNYSETKVSQEDSIMETTVSIMDNINISTATEMNLLSERITSFDVDDTSEATTIDNSTDTLDTLEDHVTSSEILSPPPETEPTFQTITTDPVSRGISLRRTRLSTSDEGCSNGFRPGPGRMGCFISILKPRTWLSAQAMCRKLQSNLVSVTSKQKMEFIWDHIIDANVYYYWIGLHKNISGNTTAAEWIWDDGSLYDTEFEQWKENEPRVADKYAVLYMSYTGQTPYWFGQWSRRTRNAFICEHAKLQKTQEVNEADVAKRKPDSTSPSRLMTERTEETASVTEPFMATSETMVKDKTEATEEPMTQAISQLMTELLTTSTEATTDPGTEADAEATEAEYASEAVTEGMAETGRPEIRAAAEAKLSGCPSGFQTSSGGCYLIKCERKTWREASATCRELDSSLSSVTSQDQMELVRINESCKQDRFWFGLHKSSSKSSLNSNPWKWEDGTQYSSNWTCWQKDHPRSKDTFAVMQLAGKGFLWYGVASGQAKLAFICGHKMQ